LKEAALWKRVEELDYEERKIVLKRVTRILEEFAFNGHLQRRSEPTAEHWLRQRDWIRLRFPKNNVLSVIAFHEKAGRGQVKFFFFLFSMVSPAE
jgi:hypothetical protein